MRLVAVVHSVLVVLVEITLACFELLGTSFCVKNLLHLILQSTIYFLVVKKTCPQVT